MCCTVCFGASVCVSAVSVYVSAVSVFVPGKTAMCCCPGVSVPRVSSCVSPMLHFSAVCCCAKVDCDDSNLYITLALCSYICIYVTV